MRPIADILLHSIAKLFISHDNNFITSTLIFYAQYLFVWFTPVVTQTYNTYGDQEDIIRGNSAILKCKIPSFVSDFLEVTGWYDDIGNVYSPEKNAFGIHI